MSDRPGKSAPDPTGATTPHELRAPEGARVMEIVWADGKTTPAAHRLLRAFCPCANCQGHQGPIEWTGATDSLPEGAFDLSEIEEVGQYAVRFTWGDGHSTGIYSFPYLRRLGDLDGVSNAELRELRFGR